MMAEAGFFHCPTEHEPDAVKCFACGKELDGWEPQDDPWQEHKSHSQSCPFLKCEKTVEELSVEEYLHLANLRYKLNLTKTIDRVSADTKEQVAEVRKEMEKLGS